MTNMTTYYWVGHPATEESTTCGIEDALELIPLLEERFGSFAQMFLTVDDLPDVVAFVTIRGYRIALQQERNVDVRSSQESISEWVAGAW
jgi:hypothetical protein